jgi:hypothetical protein
MSFPEPAPAQNILAALISPLHNITAGAIPRTKGKHSVHASLSLRTVEGTHPIGLDLAELGENAGENYEPHSHR